MAETTAAKTKKLSAVKAEAQDDNTVTFEVEINGRTIELTAPRDLSTADAEAYIAYEERKYGLMMKCILGEAQWTMLRNAGMTTHDVLNVLFSAYREATGLGED